MMQLYSEQPTRTRTRLAYANSYTLHTADWFEVGGAYTLHKDLTSAKKHRLKQSYWVIARVGVPVFVSPNTLEKIIARSQRNPIQDSWEN